MQIREYLKQAYTMLSTLQDSNDLANYASQMNKLHSLIDHLKDQEKGYMDLLDSFSKFQQLTKSLYNDSTANNKETDMNLSFNSKAKIFSTQLNPSMGANPLDQYQKDILDLSELNESIYQQHQKQQSQQNELLKRKKSIEGKIVICPK